jgi:hypothetical protein
MGTPSLGNSSPGAPTADPHRSTALQADGARKAHRPRRRGAARTGVGAAAVTTVVAIVASAHALGSDEQPTKRDAGSKVSAGRESAERSSRDQTRGPVTVQGGKDNKDGKGQRKPGLEEQLSERFPLDPKLALNGRFTAASGHEQAPHRGARHYTYRVDVENGLRLDGALFARMVHKTLNDQRSWAHGGEKSFERVSSGRADFVVTLASPGTVGKWCGKVGLDTTQQNVSCDVNTTERVMINAFRWARGSETFGDDLLNYRRMLINHEVGHRLGNGHLACGTDGALAPVMMQQTKTLSTEGRTCKPNAWVHPE